MKDCKSRNPFSWALIILCMIATRILNFIYVTIYYYFAPFFVIAICFVHGEQTNEVVQYLDLSVFDDKKSPFSGKK